jgi:hypothetical protein
MPSLKVSMQVNTILHTLGVLYYLILEHGNPYYLFLFSFMKSVFLYKLLVHSTRKKQYINPENQLPKNEQDQPNALTIRKIPDIFYAIIVELFAVYCCYTIPSATQSSVAPHNCINCLANTNIRNQIILL